MAHESDIMSDGHCKEINVILLMNSFLKQFLK